MITYTLTLLYYFVLIDGKHFNGGTIQWEPISPYANSSTVPITITQIYSWAYPTISCATNVPISTSGRSNANANLTCTADCSTDGGYSTKPVNILTDCTSTSSALGMMTSERSVNITLTADAHFYLSYMGSAWVGLNYPAQTGLQWSITTFIDLRLRGDGFINTPPVASVVSPQYAIVNTSTQIKIPVSDANVGDDVRCRWSKYIPGVNRRRRSVEDKHRQYKAFRHVYKKLFIDSETIHIRNKRGGCGSCSSWCAKGCSCSCSGCIGTTCNGSSCTKNKGCPSLSTTVATTTTETPGTLASTISYATRQAIDECGSICYPGSLPNGTTLSNCTLSFIGLVPNTWYAVAIQVEDFINSSSNTPMSSVPVQFLIYVMPEPFCPQSPQIIPVTDCMEVLTGIAKSFNIYAMTMCDPNDVDIDEIVVTNGISGMVIGSLTKSSSNSSLSYKTFTWTPQANQIGLQELCVVAFTE
ncbi:unnamed protein product [Rotaria sp. Silwood1]|nr:unnamed protein product [Rotaria sp. Silwood1]